MSKYSSIAQDSIDTINKYIWIKSLIKLYGNCVDRFLKKDVFLLLVLFCLSLSAQNNLGKGERKIADKPLFRDAIYDGAADPTIIWNSKEKKLSVIEIN